MKPRSIPYASCRILATGATQFVVQEAFEMMWCCSGSYSPSLTPRTMREVRDRWPGRRSRPSWRRPARCFSASARFVKRPVDSIATSTPSSAQGRSAGSRSETNLISCPPTVIESSPASTGTSSVAEHGVVPEQVRHRLRVADVVRRPRSRSRRPAASWARRKFRPMRPKPLIPTLVFAISSPSRLVVRCQSSLTAPVAGRNP